MEFRKVNTKDFSKKIKRMDEKKILIVILALAALCILFGALTKEDPAVAFGRTVEQFVHTTAAYNPEDAVRFASGTARPIVMGQLQKIVEARQKGLQTEITYVHTDVKSIAKSSGTVKAEVVVRTIETWPNKNPENWEHVFAMEGEKIGSAWKISGFMEIQTRKLGEGGAQ